MDIISSLSKLLNGLVTKKIKEDIGKDVSFDVDTTKYGIIINVKGYLPEIVKNPNSDGWDITLVILKNLIGGNPWTKTTRKSCTQYLVNK